MALASNVPAELNFCLGEVAAKCIGALLASNHTVQSVNLIPTLAGITSSILFRSFWRSCCPVQNNLAHD